MRICPQDRHIDQWNRTETPRISLTPWAGESTQDARTIQQGAGRLPANGAVKAEHPPAEGWSWTWNYLTPHTKNNSKWIKSKCTTPNYKTPRRKHRAKSFTTLDLWWLLVYDNKGPGNSNKNRQTGLHDASEMHQKTPSTEQEDNPWDLQNIFKSSICYGIRDLISRICREPVKLNHTKKQTTLFKNGQKTE